MKPLFLTTVSRLSVLRLSVLCLSFLCLSFATAQGQSVVRVAQISADYAATPPTVSFRVFWDTDPDGITHLDSVWLFVDYQTVQPNGLTGAWTPATLVSPAVATSGTVIHVAGNTRGFYLRGTTAPFSSTVTVALDGLSAGDRFNWCTYASDYPPNATENNGTYDLHGTPPFIINGSTTVAGTQFSGCIDALTDATGCPGLAPPTPAITSFIAQPDTICAGDTVTLIAVAVNASVYSFDGGATGIVSAISGVTAKITPSQDTVCTIQVSNGGGCVVAGTPASVTVYPAAVAAFVNPPDSACAGSTVTLTVENNSGSSYCFTHSCTACGHNPYTSGNNIATEFYCDLNNDTCVYSTSNTYSLPIPDSGSVTVWARVLTEHGCADSVSWTVGVASEAPVAELISGSETQTIAVDTLLSPIVYSIPGAVSVSVTGLPNGITGSWASPTLTISGTATTEALAAASAYTYTVIATDATGCAFDVAQGVLSVSKTFSFTVESNGTSFSFDAIIDGGYMAIDWGDGSPVEIFTPAAGSRINYPHTYPVGNGTYTATATASSLTEFNIFYGNNFTALNLNDCPTLTRLYIYDCPYLTSLDLSNHPALEYLLLRCCAGLVTLDVSNCTKLVSLLFTNSYVLTTLDVTGCTALISLVCQNTSLTELDVSSCTALVLLECVNSELITLDVSNCTALHGLICDNNSLTELDVSNCVLLYYLYCRDNNLSATALDALFNSLPSNNSNCIEYENNPGSSTCTPSIYTGKGWTNSCYNHPTTPIQPC
ncbi:MAG: hypothetical protein LBS12_02130 [Prevotellaceae bacterium]|jgi:hypothetical protein|nr:hypothetical protein [Prevotellaceae bacterium]